MSLTVYPMSGTSGSMSEPRGAIVRRGAWFGNLAVGADGDVAHREARLARLGPDPPFRVGVAKPTHVELPPGRSLEVVEIQTQCHGVPPSASGRTHETRSVPSSPFLDSVRRRPDGARGRK